MSSSPMEPVGPRPESMQVGPPHPSLLLPPDYAQKSGKPPRVPSKNWGSLPSSLDTKPSVGGRDYADLIIISARMIVVILAGLFLLVKSLW